MGRTDELYTHANKESTMSKAQDGFEKFFAELGHDPGTIFTDNFKRELKQAYYTGRMEGMEAQLNATHRSIPAPITSIFPTPPPSWDVPDKGSDVSRALSILVNAQLSEGTPPDRITISSSFGGVCLNISEAQEQCDIAKKCPYCETRMEFQSYEDSYYTNRDSTAIFQCPHCHAYENIVRHPSTKDV